MKETILDKIMNTGIPIIKPGVIVRLAKTNEEVYIRTAYLYPDSSVVYTGYIFKDDNQRHELNAIYPNEIKDYDKTISTNVKLNEPVSVKVKDEIDLPAMIHELYTEIAAARTAIYNGGTLYSGDGATDRFNSAEEAYRNLLLRFELRTSSSYGYTDGKLVLANDSYIVVYFRSNSADSFIPMDYITRKVILKPFIKRFFTTILYGRSHPNNFSYIEDNKSFTARLLELIINQQKEKGYIQYNRAEIMI